MASTSTNHPLTHRHPRPPPILTRAAPSPIPPPRNLQIRLPPQAATFAELDAAASQNHQNDSSSGPSFPSGQILDQDRMVGKGRIEARDGEEELKWREARDVLDGWKVGREGYVRLASERLMAVTGERNGLGFDRPDMPHSISPTFQRLSPSILDGGLSALFHARNPNSHQNSTLTNPANPTNLTNPISTHPTHPTARNPLSPLSPTGFAHEVNPETGKGLREWLLSRGKEFGQRKRECGSISFHDFTPDMRTNRHSNLLIAHFNGGGVGERVVGYEVDLPTTCTDPNTGQTSITTETWLYFLISRPVLTLSSSSEHSTFPPNTTPFSTPPIDHTFISPSGQTYYQHHPSPGLRPPPDFDFPIPTSWVVFACPAANVTTYPEYRDDSAPTTMPAAPLPFLPASHLRKERRGDVGEKKDEMVYKRNDYDFSHQGVPLFEFSLSSSFPGPGREHIDFLSVGSIGSWHASDAYGELSQGEWQAKHAVWLQGAQIELDAMGERERDEEMKHGRFRNLEVPSSKRGIWWERFYEGMYRDEARWRWVKEAMARGRCRVVIRWAENKIDDVVQTDGGSQHDVGLGIDLGRDVGQDSAGKKVKGRERSRGSLAPIRTLTTRAETRRRSGLGVYATAVGGDGAGGLSESSRSRAVGNRDMGGAAAAGGMVGRKIRKK